MNNFINIKELLSWDYLIQSPYITLRYEKVVIFLLITCLLVSFTLLILSRKKITELRLHRKIFKYLGLFLFFTDLYGFLVYFSRVQSLPIFSMRLMMLLWILILLSGFILTLLYFIFKYRKDLLAYKKEEERRRYIPKKKY